MNIFVEIKKIDHFTGNTVTFHTLQLENRENNEFTDFIYRHIDLEEIQEQLIFLNEKLEIFSHDGQKNISSDLKDHFMPCLHLPDTWKWSLKVIH